MPRSAHPQGLTLADLTIGRRIVMRFANDLESNTIYVVGSEPFEYGDTLAFAEIIRTDENADDVDRLRIKACIRVVNEATDKESTFFLEDMGIVADTNGNWSGAYVVDAPPGM